MGRLPGMDAMITLRDVDTTDGASSSGPIGRRPLRTIARAAVDESPDVNVVDAFGGRPI
ncbi:MAG: hypothetical protein U0V73_14235 [Acidimicrobiia bacterium]